MPSRQLTAGGTVFLLLTGERVVVPQVGVLPWVVKRIAAGSAVQLSAAREFNLQTAEIVLVRVRGFVVSDRPLMLPLGGSASVAKVCGPVRVRAALVLTQFEHKYIR
jgi:hypothetical protein